jgi:transcription antitermination factor NusG
VSDFEEQLTAEETPVAVDVIDEDLESVEEEIDPALAEFRRVLQSAPGEWFVVHSYAGFEKRVKTNLQHRIASMNMEDYIFQIEVPEEEVMEIKNGQRKQVKRNIYPGYVLVRMDLTDESWSCVRNTPGVTGFVGNSHHPSPLPLDEVEKMIEEVREARDQTCRFLYRRIRHRYGWSVCNASCDDQRDHAGAGETKGFGIDFRSRDPGRALVQSGSEDLSKSKEEEKGERKWHRRRRSRRSSSCRFRLVLRPLRHR